MKNYVKYDIIIIMPNGSVAINPESPQNWGRRIQMKEIIYGIALKHVSSLGMDNYHTIFLTNMVVRKQSHPNEKMDVIATKVMKLMTKVYGKKNLIETSARKSLNRLEVALDRSNVPNEWLTGQSVSHVVKKLVKIVEEEIDD